ncbi:MAG: hypothetical protein U0269_26800 [Polyangiales bacterium]
MRTHVIPSLTVALLLAACTRGAATPQPVAVAKDQGSENTSHPTSVEPLAANEPDASAPIAAQPGGLDASSPSEPSLDASIASAQDSASPAACANDTDCVLVTGGCQGPMAAHRSEAATVDAQNRRLLSVASCDGRFAARPVRAVCAQTRCVLEPMDHPEWRVCERTRECAPVHRNCQHWQSINRRFEREAREAMHLSRPCGPIVVPPPPRIECRYRWCVAGWEGE